MKANEDMTPEEAQEWRALALCFMAAIAEDEERTAAKRPHSRR